MILNSDLSGFQYEYSSERTLSWLIERNTTVYVDQMNKVTHSYTIINAGMMRDWFTSLVRPTVEEKLSSLSLRNTSEVEDSELTLMIAMGLSLVDQAFKLLYHPKRDAW